MFSEVVVKDWFFWFCALSGTILFLLQILFFHIGVDGHDDLDAEFKWLSKQAIAGFLALFGWIGLTCTRQFGLGVYPTLGWAFGGGVIAFFVTGLIFKGAGKLKSSGSVFSIDDIVGKMGQIYQQIPVEGMGKISVILHDLTYEVDAISSHGELLQSFTEVQIIKKVDEKTVMVVPLK